MAQPYAHPSLHSPNSHTRSVLAPPFCSAGYQLGRVPVQGHTASWCWSQHQEPVSPSFALQQDQLGRATLERQCKNQRGPGQGKGPGPMLLGLSFLAASYTPLTSWYPPTHGEADALLGPEATSQGTGKGGGASVHLDQGTAEIGRRLKGMGLCPRGSLLSLALLRLDLPQDRGECQTPPPAPLCKQHPPPPAMLCQASQHHASCNDVPQSLGE